MKSLEAKVEGLIGLNNNTCKISDAVNSLEAKVASLNVLNNKTYGSSVAVESLETKMEKSYWTEKQYFWHQRWCEILSTKGGEY